MGNEELPEIQQPIGSVYIKRRRAFEAVIAMDRRLLTIWLICLVWMGWFLYNDSIKAKKAKVEAEKIAAEMKDVPPVDKKEIASGEKGEVKEAPEAEKTIEKIDNIALGTDQIGKDAPYYLHALLTNEGAAVRDLYLNDYDNEYRDGRLHLLNEETSGVLSYLLDVVGDESLRSKTWEVTTNQPNQVGFKTLAKKGSVEVKKDFILDEKSRATRLVLEFTNKSNEAIPGFHYRLTGGNGVPIEGDWYTRYFRSAEFVLRSPDNPYGKLEEVTASTIVSKNDNNTPQPSFSVSPVQFAGVTSQYFTTLVVQPFDLSKEVEKNQIADATPLFIAKNVKHPEWSNIGVEMRSVSFDLQPGQTVRHEYLLYNGPKKESTLQEFSQFRLQDIIHYPPFMFIPVGGVSVILVSIMEFFYSWVGDYGIAIILLTVVVRACLFPLNYWQNKTMGRMQAIQPMMEKIRKECGDDLQEYSRQMRALQSEYKVNPYMGCLPALLQLPILVGLWQGLALDFQLRQAPFLFGYTWIQDLSAPDMLFRWPESLMFLDTFFGLGPYFNLLPLISLGLIITVMLFTTPQTNSPEAKSMRTMMIFMMVFMSFMFYKVPSGLCIYIITGSIWGIAERKLMPKPQLPTALVERAEQAKMAMQSGSKDDLSWKKPLDQKKKTAKK